MTHELEPGAFGSGLESRPWFEVTVHFEAISFADAVTVVEEMMFAACRGAGRDDDHQCRFGAIGIGPKEVDLEEEDEHGGA